eukprot:11189410-Lingulodinium_polyedra.AAC.1
MALERQRCLSTLAPGARLCTSIVDLEFPAMDLVGCCNAFDLARCSDDTAARRTANGEVAAMLERVANMLGVCRRALAAGFCTLLPRRIAGLPEEAVQQARGVGHRLP